jgi:hypothetical protein
MGNRKRKLLRGQKKKMAHYYCFGRVCGKKGMGQEEVRKYENGIGQNRRWTWGNPFSCSDNVSLILFRITLRLAKHHLLLFILDFNIENGP